VQTPNSQPTCSATGRTKRSGIREGSGFGEIGGEGGH
jgi:hypothetical protein